jgi:hypothetical protein
LWESAELESMVVHAWLWLVVTSEIGCRWARVNIAEVFVDAGCSETTEHSVSDKRRCLVVEWRAWCFLDRRAVPVARKQKRGRAGEIRDRTWGAWRKR